MIGYMFTLLCGIVGSVVMIIYHKRFTESFGIISGILFLIGVVAMFVIAAVASINAIIKLSKDIKSLKINDYVSVVGKVLKFKRNLNPDTGIQINDTPIVLILDTNEEIELIINDKVKVGEIYRFNYLKNCKIAEVIEKC